MPIGSGLSPLVNPHGTLMPGNPGDVARHREHIAQIHLTADRPLFSPTLNAGVGLVGLRITSHFLNASSKSRLISARIFCART